MPNQTNDYSKLEVLLTDAYRIISKYRYTGVVEDIHKLGHNSGRSQFGEYVRQQYRNPEVKVWFKKTYKTLSDYKMNQTMFQNNINDIDPSASTVTYIKHFLRAVNELEKILSNPSRRNVYLIQNTYGSRVKYKRPKVLYSSNHTFQEGKTIAMFDYLWPYHKVIEADGTVSRTGRPQSRKLVEKETKLSEDAQIAARNAANVVLRRDGIPVRLRSRRKDHTWQIIVDYSAT